MKPSQTSAAIARYLERQAFTYPLADALPSPAVGLKLGVVIPCLAESSLLPAVLDSLEQGSQRLAEAEVVVLVNNPEDSSPEILADNLATLQALRLRPGHGLPILPADYASPSRGLDPSQAGVGLARRLGMDLALRRLAAAGSVQRAAIACLDADSPVDPGYVDALLEAFDGADPPLAGICRYAHPWPEDGNGTLAITAYELWLRYYEAGLQLSGSLFAFPTIGSCTVVSAEGYALADGMPLRKAAEDFHFLRKVAKVSGNRPLARIHQAVVHPLARVSNRVLFGTGRAMQRCQEEGCRAYFYAEPAEAFLEVKCFLEAAGETREPGRLLRAAPPRLAAFLEKEQAGPILEKFHRNYPDQARFTLAVQHWFDSLRIVRFANTCSRQMGRTWITDALRQVFSGMGREGLLDGLPEVPAGDEDPGPLQTWLKRLREVS